MNDTTIPVFPNAAGGRYPQPHLLMYYYYNERYLLPLSHDEVVHRKGDNPSEDEWRLRGQVPQARALYLYMTAHPGKKLNFMGASSGSSGMGRSREQDWTCWKIPI